MMLWATQLAPARHVPQVGASVTVTGTFLDGPLDDVVQLTKAATTAKASRQAATNAGRPRRLTTGCPEARP
jgi:hypothetical protein